LVLNFLDHYRPMNNFLRIEDVADVLSIFTGCVIE